jgi:hypothetical protein
MIPNETLQVIETLGQTAPVGNFRITDATQARILVSLSDKMYTRKELAVVREYSTNAADAHVVVDKSINDIQVSLPTMEDLNFRIRDFGTGLTEVEIRDVYCVFGESTKRNSNKLNGVLGYGCKAGFAHADSFTVTSWSNGVKSVYQCVKGDSTKLHSSIRLCQEASTDPSGIEICVPVKQNSWYTFHREAIAFYRCWPTLPTIKNLSPDDTAALTKFRETSATLKGNGWEVRPASDGAQGVAYMGWVPYQIDWNVLYHKMALDAKSRTLFELLRVNDVILYFNMGEINFVDSREYLEYTDGTLNAIVTRIKEIFDSIKDAIQEKFTGQPNLWAARIVYNAIFGTGILEFEKGETPERDVTERIKILEGNLLNLERTFQDAFTWNGIIIKGPSFRDINRFDNKNPTEIFSGAHEPDAPVMVTYRKKKNRVKANRCRANSNNSIMASDQVAVLYNDTGHKTGQQMSARYLIFGAPKTYKTVYVLSFADKSLKDLFIKEYNFETVPIIRMSEIMPAAKTWYKANKVSRNYGSGGGGTRAMQYLDLETGTMEESEVPVREIEDGAIYIDLESVSRARRTRRNREPSRTYHLKTHNNWGNIEAEASIANFKMVAEELDLDVDRIYIINSKTSESKWFKQALESGDWTNIWVMIKEAIPTLTMDVNMMVDAENYEDTTVVCEEAAKLLLPMIMDKTGPILKLIATVGNVDYDKCIELKDAFASLYLWDMVKGEAKGTVDFKTSAEAARLAYPFLEWNDLERDYNVTPEKIVAIARYVNAMDLYVDLTKGTEPIEKIPVVAEPPKVEETEAVVS